MKISVIFLLYFIVWSLLLPIDYFESQRPPLGFCAGLSLSCTSRKNGSPGGYWSQLEGDHAMPSLGPSTRCNWKVWRGRFEKFGRLKWSKVPQKVTRSPAFTSTGMKPSSNREVWGRLPSHVTLALSSCCRNVSLGDSVLPFSKYSGLRMNWRLTGSLWDPGRTQRHPFSSVASSKANQSPRQVCRGVVNKNVLSWWEWTVPNSNDNAMQISGTLSQQHNINQAIN